MPYLRCKLFIATLWCCAAASSWAQNGNFSCESGEFRHLDFWVGSWAVYNLQRESVAESKIEKILRGCAIQENYRANSGYTGTSLNQFDPAAGKWLQFWLDINATSVRFVGERIDNAMVFSVKELEDDNGIYERRMQVIDFAPDEVHQISERSYDHGQNWIPEYSFIYRRSDN